MGEIVGVQDIPDGHAQYVAFPVVPSTSAQRHDQNTVFAGLRSTHCGDTAAVTGMPPGVTQPAPPSGPSPALSWP
jgi:hypothetical protein